MKTILLITMSLFGLTLCGQNDRVVLKNQDTVVIIPEDRESAYYLEVNTSLTPQELHSITAKYPEYSFYFKVKEDLFLTMSKYLDDGKILVDWNLTKNEKLLLKKFKKAQFAEWKNSSSSNNRQPSKKIVTTGDHLKRAGKYKNASIAVLVASLTASNALIQADPINGPTAAVIGITGGLISLGLNIAGNMELMAAGKQIKP